jgi:demethoxyubiquinone hydroxylase (CLK1/Coq7/Cat5 family)
LTHEVFIPPLTLEAFKPTVLNCFWFRQTNLIPGAAAGECAAPLDFNLAWKIETVLSLYLHDELETMPLRDLKAAIRCR